MLADGLLRVCFIRSNACRIRRGEETTPLLASISQGSSAKWAEQADDWEADGVVRIGVPARDFVRLSALAQAASSCMACSEAGRPCVSLRPCGHALLCRACAEFASSCPKCGQRVTGIGLCAVR